MLRAMGRRPFAKLSEARLMPQFRQEVEIELCCEISREGCT